jgi:hypothetical protein
MDTQSGHEESGKETEFERFNVKGSRERALARLRRLIAEGEASGDYQEIDFDELLADLES